MSSVPSEYIDDLQRIVLSTLNRVEQLRMRVLFGVDIVKGSYGQELQFKNDGKAYIDDIEIGAGGGGFIQVDGYGAVGDGITDDSAAFISALAALGPTGGIVIINSEKKYLIDNDVTVPAGCAIQGGVLHPGTLGNNTNTPYDNYGSALIVNSSARILLYSSSSLSQLIIYRKGMTFPASNSSAFSGTAVDIKGDDAHISDCIILGFAKAINSNGYQRPRCAYVFIDCTSGIAINNCWDIAYLDNCHCWPYSTIKTYKDGGSSDDTIIERSGTAFSFTNVADWARVTNCFAYAYMNDFQCTDVNSVTFIGCGADGTTPRTGRNSAGFSIIGNSNEIRMDACQMGGQWYGVYLGVTAAHTPTFVNNCSIWSCSNGVYITDGDLVATGGTIRDCPVAVHILADDAIITGMIMRGISGYSFMTNGIYIDGATSRVTVDDCIFQNISSAAIVNNANTPYLQIGTNSYENITYKPVHEAGVIFTQIIASASTITLPANGNYFKISGTIDINVIQGGWHGRTVTLRFSDVLTVNDPGIPGLELNGVCETKAGTILTLVAQDYDSWFEVSRSSSIVIVDGATSVTESQIVADHAKLSGIESGATQDQTGTEIVSLINASADLIDDNNIATSITRDSELSAHAGSASAHHSSTSNALNITPSKINCADIRNPSGAAMAFRTSAGDTHFYSGDDTNGVTFARHVRPYSDNAYVMGDASHRWSLVRGVTVTSGDLGFEETTCPKCGKSFEIGDTLILVVKSLHEYGTLTIPMHLQCVGLSPVGISLPVPQMRDEWVMEGKELKTIRVPDTEMITKTILKTRPHFEFVNGINIQHHPILDTKTGKFKLKGKIISKNRATQLVDETVEVPIYKDVRIVI